MRFHSARLRSDASAILAVFALSCALTSSLPAQKPSESKVLHGPVGQTEVGVLDGADYRIDIPNDWNHSLVVFYHGYSTGPYTYHLAEKVSGQVQPFLDRHYAVIESGYSRSGWALEQAYPETESLRHYFIRQYGEPKETYAAGASMGGELVSITLEINPKPYLGGLDLCGAVGPTSEAFERRFAWRAAFDFYFPAVMPTLVLTPSTFEDTAADRDRIAFALRANPVAATKMRSLMGLHTDADVAWDIAYFTFVVEDMQHRAGGNPFDNRNYIYTNTGTTISDAELNDHVQRYAANPRAREYLVRHYTPSGNLGRPMLALHSLYDPLIPPGTLALYTHEVEAAGAGENFVQQYVHSEGHCAFNDQEIGRAFDELIQWTHNGPRPTAGLLH